MSRKVWVIVVTTPGVEGSLPSREVFNCAIEDEDAAVKATREFVGAVASALVEAKARLSDAAIRALALLPGQIERAYR